MLAASLKETPEPEKESDNTTCAGLLVLDNVIFLFVPRVA